MKRPWRVHVKDIGPNYSFATEEAARERARACVGPAFVLGDTLVGNWATAIVWKALTPDDVVGEHLKPLRRWIYRHDTVHVREEVLNTTGSGWILAEH